MQKKNASHCSNYENYRLQRERGETLAFEDEEEERKKMLCLPSDVMNRTTCWGAAVPELELDEHRCHVTPSAILVFSFEAHSGVNSRSNGKEAAMKGEGGEGGIEQNHRRRRQSVAGVSSPNSVLECMIAFLVYCSCCS